jgi:CARDB protein
MFETFRTRFALAIAAAAIVGTSLAPIAALAAPLAPATERENVEFKPDLKVTVQQVHYFDYNDMYDVVYDVQNIGTMNSGVFTVKAVCENQDGDHWIAVAAVYPGLKKGMTTQRSFKCEEGWGAQITVSTQNDADTSNNYATAGNFLHPSF